MAIQIKPMAQIVQKWQTRAGAAGAAYVSGVQNPRRPQGQAAAAAAQSWATGVQQAVTDNRFATRVLAAQDKYTANATSKGAARYPDGISRGGPNFSAGLTPYLTVISNLNLPPRMPKGDPSNVQRVAAIDAALRAAKLASGK
ncbi:MAG: hypothetical protein ACRD2P_12260 [Terriglobia bacterium]